MKKRLSREKDDRGRVITIPNLLSLLRLCLIPVIVWLYLVRGNQFAAGCLMVLSGLTDVMDGRIARRFHMVSDLGKALDPIADKATQAAVLICLIAKFPLMVLPLIFLLGKELCMAVIGILLIRKTGEVPQACWHGKVVTAVLYTVMICHDLSCVLVEDPPGAVRCPDCDLFAADWNIWNFVSVSICAVVMSKESFVRFRPGVGKIGKHRKGR